MADKDGAFDTHVASTYDERHGATSPDALNATVDTLAALAEGGAILEFAIGTGRIALPLAARGIPVSGIELSAAMVDHMRAKLGGANIPVVIGDMTNAQVPGPFALVALVFNTIDNLTTQDAQVACFENAAAHLQPGGRFVVETLIPPLQDLPFGECKRAFAADDDHFGMDVFDVAQQTYSSRHVWMTKTGTDTLTVQFRYAWPAEMDLMARIAGLTLEHRWSDWSRSPFTRTSRSHISVWQKPA
ncbi:class I SAM-dependent methyltransferase [Tateyamaria sp. syn59]|uniref:class I SAM-dependent DNA methyltransferase n=1 Tax=Tateyamaria sp. syn59 TaxID=2576942 RepID=UPI0011BE73E9|nr:class I SAM-dependent methyltransferase [Tateyamaria sp. syn59]